MIRAAYSGVVQFIFDGSIRTAHLLPIQFSARLVAAVNEPSPRLSLRPRRALRLPRRAAQPRTKQPRDATNTFMPSPASKSVYAII